MALNIEVEGKPAELRETADYCRSAARSVRDSADDVHRSSAESETAWEGPAGESFQQLCGRVHGKAEDVADDFTSSAAALEDHAAELDIVIAEMARARSIAAAAGLSTTDTTIHEPGRGPAAPGTLPADASAAQVSQHDEAVAAVVRHQRQVQAYTEASDIVARAREREHEAQSLLRRLLQNIAGKSPFIIMDFAGGMAAFSIERTAKFRAKVAVFVTRAAERRAKAQAETLRLLRFGNRVGARLDDVSARFFRALETPTPWSKGVDKLPSVVKGGLLLRVAPDAVPVLRHVPVLGVAVTAAGVGIAIGQGQDPTQAIVSGTSSLVAGAVVGAAIGGPVGLVAGAVVGAGVGFVVDEWGDEIAAGAGHAAEAVGNAAEDAWDTVSGWFG